MKLLGDTKGKKYFLIFLRFVYFYNSDILKYGLLIKILVLEAKDKINITLYF